MNTNTTDLHNQPRADDRARPRRAQIAAAGRHSPWKRRLFASLLGIHGFAHLVGATDATTAIADSAAVDYLFGQWHIGDSSALFAAGTIWSLVALAFAVTAVSVWVDSLRWPTLLVASAASSLVVCLIALPQAAIGIPIDLALLAAAARWRARNRGEAE